MKCLIEVKKEGKTYFRTDSKECIPDKEDLISMKKAGYKLYMNGKIWKG